MLRPHQGSGEALALEATPREGVDCRLLGERPRWVIAHLTPLPGDEPADPRLLLQVQDVTGRREAARKLEHLAAHDALTGVKNRRAFDSALREHHTGRRFPDRRGACAFVDLDGFKSINDRHGHAAGDEALRRVATAMVATLREDDLVGRLGGNEFGVLLGAVDREGAVHVAHTLLRAITEVEVGRPDVTLSASAGVAMLAEHEDPALAADAAMYRVKAVGGGRVELPRRWDVSISSLPVRLDGEHPAKGDEIPHDYKHVDRVRHWALKIAQAEHYPHKDWVEAAALLHDIGLASGGRKHHAEVGAKLATTFLREHNLFEEDAIREIVNAIRYHTSLDARGKLLDILRDADVLDVLGAVGLMRGFTSKWDKPDYAPHAIKGETWGMSAAQFTERFQSGVGIGETIVDQINFQMSCYENLRTDAAKAFGQPLVEFMRTFMDAFEAQINGGKSDTESG